MNKAEILKLIKEHVYGVLTIEPQRMDSLDFHDVHISSLVALVEKSFENGKNSVLNRQHWDVVPKTRVIEYGDQYD